MSGLSMTKYVRRISFVAVLLFSLSLSVSAQAVEPSVESSEVGSIAKDVPNKEIAYTIEATNATSNLKNGVFNDDGRNANCSLEYWSFGDTTQAMTEEEARIPTTYPNKCIANLHSNAENANPITTLSQTFEVSDSHPFIAADIWPESNGGTIEFAAQTISLYDQEGRLIYSKSRNHTATRWMMFYYDLSAYVGTEVTLYFETAVDLRDESSPSRAILSVDNVRLLKEGKPLINPGTEPITGW